MIFSPELIGKVLAGEKTQTRRRVKNGESCRYVAGRTYAIQPGRGKPAVGRLRVLAIEKRTVGDIDQADAEAEGFASRVRFWAWWNDRYGDIRGELCWRIEFELVQP